MRVLLDSTVLIDYLRGRPVVSRVRALRDSADVPCTTGINVEEVIRGIRPAEVDATRAFFAGLEIIPIGSAEGWRAGGWRRDFSAQGITLWQADCLVAAAAIAVGARLATGNPRDFPMPEVTVEHWPVGR